MFTQYDWAENLFLSLHRNDFIHRNEFIGSCLSPLFGKPDTRIPDVRTSTSRIPDVRTSTTRIPDSLTSSASLSSSSLPSVPPVLSVLSIDSSNLSPPLSSPSMMSMKSACLSSLKEQTSVSTVAVRVDGTSQNCDIKIENNETNDNGKRSREFVCGNDGRES
jgi:hypothetical protein